MGGWGDVANGKASATSGRKGGWGSLANAGVDVAHQQTHGGGGWFGSAFHWVGSKLGMAGHDIAQIPGGTYHLLKPLPTAIYDVGRYGPLDAWGGKQGAAAENATFHDAARQTTGLIKSSEQAIRHPLRDPFQTALTVAPLLHGFGRIGEVAGAAGKAARAGEGTAGAIRAAGRELAPHEPTPRTITVGDRNATLIPSHNAAGRYLQRGYDRMIQKAINREAAAGSAGQTVGRVTARVAEHGIKRAKGALLEEERIAQRMGAVPANMLDNAARRLTNPAKAIGAVGRKAGQRAVYGDALPRLHQAALELTSTQTPAEEAAAYHYAQAAKNVNPELNRAVGRLYERVSKANLVHVDESRPAGEKVYINPAHGKLAAADKQLARVQQRGDTILAEHGVMTSEQLQARADAPARIRAGAHYEKPTPGKLGAPSPALQRARAAVETLQKRHDRLVAAERPQEAQRVGGALSVAKDKLQTIEAQASNRVKPTGIVGGEHARPGRGFVSERVSDKKLARTEVARSRGPVTGEQRPPIDRKSYTGRALEAGLRPKNVTGSASLHFRQLQRFVNTDRLRRTAVDTGSDVRQSTRQVLVRVPGETADQINHFIRQILGQETRAHDTADELTRQAEDQATAVGLATAHQMILQHVLDKVDESRNAGLGEHAPAGYRWVDENMIHGLQQEAQRRGGAGAKLGRGFDNVNSAVTSATVYFKVGHTGTRVLTNAATNLIQGSLSPLQLKYGVDLWHELSPEEQQRALAAAGQHGFAALPHEGDTVVSRVASRGANFWARHADAPFRFNSLSYELRKAGYNTADKFRHALDALENTGHGLPAHEWAKISAAARRADREAISYDRLNDFERRFLTRAVWFYPWVKGASLFTVRTMLEHPVKAAIGANLGAYGRQQQYKELGAVPSYEEGLVNVGGGSNPLTSDFSTFSPFATGGQLIEAPIHPGSAAGYLNPALGALGQFAYGLNQYGAPSSKPYTDALLALAAATPEQQLAEAYAARGQDQSGRMFVKTPESTILRYLVGPAMPRRVNKSALAKAAAREKSGRR